MHAQSNQVLSDRNPSGLGVVVAGIAIAASVAVGAVIGVNLASKAAPLAGGYHLITPSAAVMSPRPGSPLPRRAAVKPIDVMPKSEAAPYVLPRTPATSSTRRRRWRRHRSGVRRPVVPARTGQSGLDLPRWRRPAHGSRRGQRGAWHPEPLACTVAARRRRRSRRGAGRRPGRGDHAGSS